MSSSEGSGPSGSRRAWAIAAVIVALVAFLPFIRGLLVGHSFYFRDLSAQVIPFRRFLVEGLLRGELRYWNPYVHEGEQISMPPISYPVDLLQLLLRGEAGLSFLLALHVPLAAVAFLFLARSMGAGPGAAAGGALVYSLGGFCLSTLNFYVYLHAMAWAPWVILGLGVAARGGRRHRALAGLLVAIALTTLGMEVVLQSILFGGVLALSVELRARLLRLAEVVALGCGLAGATLLVIPDVFLGSQRAAGFSPEVVLAHSVHPLTFLQVVIGNFHGDLQDITRLWWGQNFFPRGFPYILSLYLGAGVLCVAATGISGQDKARVRIGLLIVGGALLCLGRWSPLGSLVEALPPLRILRYPVKAFFTVHLGVALLVTFGLNALAIHQGGSWRRLRLLALGSGFPLALAPALPWLAPRPFGGFLGGFFPPDLPWSARLDNASALLHDASTGGIVAVAVGLLATLVLRNAVSAPTGTRLVVGLLAADLLRTGDGLNPMVSTSFFELSQQMSSEAELLRKGGRVFTCDPMESQAYLGVRSLLARNGIPHEALTFAVARETLSLNYSMEARVRSAYSLDLNMFVPLPRVLSPEESACRSLPGIVDRLRRAGVSRVLSLDPLHHPDLSLEGLVRSERLAPLVVRVYSLGGALPLRFVASAVRTRRDPLDSDDAFQQAGGTTLEDTGGEVREASGRILDLTEAPGRIVTTVNADRPTALVLRDAWAPGWSASVNGTPSGVVRADGRHLAVRILAGTSRVSLRYTPPHLKAGLVATLLSTGWVVVLWRLGRPDTRRPDGSSAA